MTVKIKDNVAESLYNLVNTITTSTAKSMKKAAVIKPVLMTFDETETMAVPKGTTLSMIVSGPSVEEDINTGSLDTQLEVQARTMANDILSGTMRDVKGVLK